MNHYRIRIGVVLTLLLTGLIALTINFTGKTQMATNAPILGQIQSSPLNIPLAQDVQNGGLVINSDPNHLFSGGNTSLQGLSTGGGTSYTAGINDPATLQAYQQSIAQTQAALGQLPHQQQIGTQNIQSGYNDALNTLLQNAKNAQQTYSTNKTQAGQSFVGAKNTINAGAGQSLQGLERLLASRGAGGSSAATLLAPQAVAQQATQQRSAANQNFGANNQALDTAYNQYTQQVNQNKTDLGRQLKNNQNALASSIQSNKANLLQALASLSAQYAAAQGGNGASAAQPYLDKANSALTAATNFGANVPVYQTTPYAYTPPALTSYSTNPYSTPSPNNQTNSILNTTIAPGLMNLLNPKQSLSGVTQV